MIYLETSYVIVEWDDDNKIVRIVWRDFAEGETYRRPLEAAADLLASKSACRLLADTRKMAVVNPEDQAWVNNIWVPRVYRAGLKYTALLVPKSAVAKMSMDRMMTKAGPPIGGETRYFDDVAKAVQWLKLPQG